jgi:NAD(P)H dehydrogenase (quinone)
MIRVAIIYHSETGNTLKQAELVESGCRKVPLVETKLMSIDAVDRAFLESAQAVLLGCPNYEGTCSWQMKQFLDGPDCVVDDKLCGVFCSQNQPGGGGGSFVEMTIIAGILVRGGMVYAGGITHGMPFLHFGAVSTQSPKGLDAQRAVKLGENIAAKAVELFGNKHDPRSTNR